MRGSHLGLRATYRDDAFYDAFGVTAADVDPLENVYLKLFHVFHVRRTQDVLAVIDGYRASFPDEAPFVDEVVGQVFLGQGSAAPTELWLANPDFETGTSLFDQLRGLPRVHTFDLNAASVVDLLAVPGVDLPLARAILAGAPYAGVADLERVPGVDAALVARFGALQAAMARLRAEAVEQDVEEVLSIQTILLPFVWRGLGVLVAAAALGALLHRRVRASGELPRLSRCGTALARLTAAVVGAGASWALGGSGLAPLGIVGLLFGLPAGLRALRRSGRPRPAGRALAAWVVAALPGVLLTLPWG